jgi:integrase
LPLAALTEIDEKRVPGSPKEGVVAERLTEALVEGLRPGNHDRFVFDSLLSGYYVRVTPEPSGKKILLAKARVDGRKVGCTLGYWPALKVAPGRELARQALADIREGRDPSVERRARQQALAAGAMTVAALREKWLAEHVSKLKPRTREDYTKLSENFILPATGHLPVANVTRDDITALHLKMEKTPTQANYVVRIARGLFSFAIDNKLRPLLDNPVRKFKFYPEREIERFLSEDEIGKATEAIEEAERTGIIGLYAAAGLRLALFTGARSAEIKATKWSQINWTRRIIRLPSPDSKNNKPRAINLSDPAIEVLQALPRVGPYVIAGAKSGGAYQNLSRAWILARALRGLDDVRLHDLRHSYASLLASQGVSLLIIGKLLGHRDPNSTQRYAHLAPAVESKVNDDLGAAMMKAIEKRAPIDSNIVKLRRVRRGR